MRWALLILFLLLSTCAPLPPNRPQAPGSRLQEKPALKSVEAPADLATTPPAPPVAKAPGQEPGARSLEPGSILDQLILGGDAGIDGGTIAIDGHGRRFVVGSFRGTASFGDLPPLFGEQEDAYLLALDATGRPLYAKRFGGSGLDYGGDVVVGSEGDVYLSGAFESSTIDLGSGPMRCAGIHDIFLARFGADGDLRWARRYGDKQDQINLRLTADPNGGVAATGWFKGTVDFGAGPVRSPWNRAAFVARIDAAGHARWSSWFGYRYDYAETASAFDPDGRLWVSGGSDDQPPAKNDLGPVLITFDSRGQKLALRRFGGGADNLSTAVVADAQGGVRLIVGSRGSVDFGPRPQNGEEALYIASFDAQGTRRWSRRLITSRILSIAAARIDAQGTTYLAGQSDEPAGTFATHETGFVIAIDSSGRVRWQKTVFLGGMTWFSGMALDPAGRVVVTGAVGRLDGQKMLNGLLILTLLP